MSAPLTPAELHERAKTNLAIKTAKLSPFVLAKRTIPNILDIYTNRTKTETDGIPAEFPLAYFFKQYHRMFRLGFHITPIAGGNFDMLRAMWYYGVDDTHSFTSRHLQVRLNIILMVFVMALDKANAPVQDFVDPACVPLITQFLRAWLSGVLPPPAGQVRTFTEQEKFLQLWTDADHDLIVFSRAQRTRAQAAVKALTQSKIPHVHLDAADFMNQAEGLSADQIREHGPALAVAYCYHHEKEYMLKGDEDAELGGVLEDMSMNVEEALM
jgi:hypothetical protein